MLHHESTAATLEAIGLGADTKLLPMRTCRRLALTPEGRGEIDGNIATVLDAMERGIRELLDAPGRASRGAVARVDEQFDAITRRLWLVDPEATLASEAAKALKRAEELRWIPDEPWSVWHRLSDNYVDVIADAEVERLRADGMTWERVEVAA